MLSIHDIESGMKLEKDVHSKLGGLLYKKDTVLYPKDTEILESFGVLKVDIKSKDSLEKTEEEETPSTYEQETMNKSKQFDELFSYALKEVEKVFKLAQGNAQIPILTIRKAIQPLLSNEFLNLKYISNLRYISNDFNKYDSHHSLSVGIISYAIATWLGIERGESMQIALAGVLHDIGMSRIPNYLVNNSRENLGFDDFNEIKKHTLYGFQIMKEAKGLNEGAKSAILQHHERIDGSGYPLKLKESSIHLYSKIVAVADVFHAMISRRSYRSEYSTFKAVEQLTHDSFGKLDPSIVNALRNKLANFAIGSTVRLSNDENGVIVYIDQNDPTKPWVQLGEKIINLAKENKLHIKEII